MNTYTGKVFDPLAIKVSDVDIRDIAHALSMMCRGGGQIAYFYSVGQHCLNCSYEAEARGYSRRLQLACLLHDASEAYIADIIRPVKRGLSNYLEIESMIMNTIWEAFHLEDLTEDEHQLWKEIDNHMLWYEFNYMMPHIKKEQVEIYSKPDVEERTHLDIEEKYLQRFEELLDGFYITEITDEIFARIKGKSFKEDCTLSREDLRYLHLLHKTLDGQIREGEMIVNYHIAQDVLNIFQKLYENDYPIEKIRLVDEYDAIDEPSMADNNSSAFNFRYISYTTTVSKHGLGLAIDINPRYNPYTKMIDGKRSVEPANGVEYLDRSKDFDYKIDENDLVYQLFTAHGFEWGGSWKHAKDYQHFEIRDSKIKEWYLR